MSRKTRALAVAGASIACAGFAQADFAHAASASERGWSNKADLSYVATSGNATTNTLGFAYKGAGAWGRNGFEVVAGGIRTSTTTDEIRNARGQADDYVLEGSSSSATTVEQYFAAARYDRTLSGRFFWFAGLGWDRNIPAGIDSRLQARGGVGHVWVDAERIKFRTDYGASFTNQSDVVDNPFVDDSYAGLRASYAYQQRFGKSVTFTNDLVLDENLSETSDWRGEMSTAVAVEMSTHLALKAGLRWLYDADPSFFSVPLLNDFGADIGDVLVERDNLDTIFTTALVVNW